MYFFPVLVLSFLLPVKTCLEKHLLMFEKGASLTNNKTPLTNNVEGEKFSPLLKLLNLNPDFFSKFSLFKLRLVNKFLPTNHLHGYFVLIKINRHTPTLKILILLF